MVFFSALVFRIFLANFGTLELDYGTFVAWGNSLSDSGFKNFYNSWSDYFPGYLYVLFLLAKINLFLPELQIVIFKFPAIISDVLTGYLIYRIVNEIKGKKIALMASALYLFNPAVFANSSLWGQVDSLTALFSLFAIYMFSKNLFVSAVALALGTLVKPQAAFVLPAILYLFITQRKKLVEYLNYSVVGLSVFVLGFIPFNNKSNLIDFILERFSISSGQYPYGSVNAFSFWGLFGFWRPDNITVWIGLGVSIILVTLVTLVVYKKRTANGEYLIASLSLLITFLFLTRIHERHLLPVFAPLVVASVNAPILLVVYGGLSVTYLANLYYAFQWISKNFKEVFNPFLIKFFIVTNISLLLLSITAIFKKFKYSLNVNFKRNSFTKVFETSDISVKKTKILLVIILVFSFASRIYSLGSIKEMYFDEIYHSFTAKLVLHNDPKAWEWWNPHPEGFAYEWTHPPLSKLGMTLGMKLFGENSFGWRIPQAVLGTLSIYLIYLLSVLIFKDRLVGILSAGVFSLEGLPLVLSRMGMNDVYVLFFSLLSVYLFAKNRNFMSAVVFGLAIASKWSAIYTLPIIFISHFVFRKKISYSYLSFLVIPLAIYVASYGLMFKTGHTWGQFIEVQKQMWWYHTNLEAQHPYTSPAWSWPLLVRPLYLYDGKVIDDQVAKIYALGNPIVFWFGLFSIILSIAISYIEKNKKLGFVVFSYLIFFIPWLASPRIMFLYHYLPSIPFLAIASGFVLRRYPKIIPYFFGVSFILFIYFYPHWTGLRIPVWLDESYYWFNSWR